LIPVNQSPNTHQKFTSQPVSLPCATPQLHLPYQPFFHAAPFVVAVFGMDKNAFPAGAEPHTPVQFGEIRL